MSTRFRRIVASLVVAVAVLSGGAGIAAAFASPSGHPPMPCCDSPDDCKARIRAAACCPTGQGPAATVPTAVAVSATSAKVAPGLPSAQPAGDLGSLTSAATAAFHLACLTRQHDPPYLLHSVFLI